MIYENESLQKIYNDIVTVADKFYSLEINQGVQELYKATGKIKNLISHERSYLIVREINDLLDLVLQCVDNKDYILVADILRYELGKQLLSLTTNPCK